MNQILVNILVNTLVNTFQAPKGDKKMRKPLIFKRGKFYHLQYFDEYEQRIKRVSTGEKIKSDALKFLTGF